MATIEKLTLGYKKFKQEYFVEHPELFTKLASKGQSPKTMIIACSDSRVDPAILTNSKPGDLFIVRNVGNLVPPFQEDAGYHGTSAAIEFAVNYLNVENIIILGHSQCGGISHMVKKAISNKPDEYKCFISKWIEIGQHVVDMLDIKHGRYSPDVCNKCARYTIINSANNLLTFPWIMDKIRRKKMSIHAWYFELETGHIYSKAILDDQVMDFNDNFVML